MASSMSILPVAFMALFSVKYFAIALVIRKRECTMNAEIYQACSISTGFCWLPFSDVYLLPNALNIKLFSNYTLVIKKETNATTYLYDFFSFCCRFCRLSCNVDVSPRIKTATENWCFSKHYMAMFIISNSLEELSFFSPRLAFI